jgi:hypothetical protein
MGRGALKLTMAVAALTAASLALPAAAGAEKFQGSSAQGKQAVVFTRPDGEVRSFSISWRTRDCDNGTRMHARWTSFQFSRGEAEADSFAGSGAFTTHYTDATVRFVGSARGAQAESGRWSGRFKIKAHIERPGGPSDDCRLGPISWSAR